MQYRQGDVLVLKIDKTPKEDLKEVPAENGKLILARGEATGHHHSVPSHVAKLFAAVAGLMILKVAQETELTHQEHGPVKLPVGDYEVRVQQEWSPLGWRQVLD